MVPKDRPNIQIEESWKEALAEEFQQDYFQELITFLKQRKAEGAKIYPPGPLIFRAFSDSPLDRTRVVILGQDPYHGPDEAHGLCFSVNKGIRIPPSLRNIFKELNNDLGLPIPSHGDLSNWSRQGVLLLNAILTVEHKSPAAHKDKGWERFTDAVIRLLSAQKEGLVFLLWGGFAKSKADQIDPNKHLILTAPHPAAEVYAGGKAGFFGSQPFSKVNAHLESLGQPPIDWRTDQE